MVDVVKLQEEHDELHSECKSLAEELKQHERKCAEYKERTKDPMATTGGRWTALQAQLEAMAAHLKAKEQHRTAIWKLLVKAKQRESEAGAGMAQVVQALGALGDQQVRAAVAARLPYSGKYACHLTAVNCEDKEYRAAAVVVHPHFIATFAHRPHNVWRVGDEVEVSAYGGAGSAGQRRLLVATVAWLEPVADVAILKVEEELPAPRLALAGPKHPFYVHGLACQPAASPSPAPSAPAPAAAASPSGPPALVHGELSADVELDRCCHVRGELLAGPAEAGAGVFSVETGALLGMYVRTDEHGKRAVLLPAGAVAGMLAGLQREERGGGGGGASGGGGAEGSGGGAGGVGGASPRERVVISWKATSAASPTRAAP